MSSLLARLTLSFTLEILLWSTGKTGKVSTPPLARLWHSFLSRTCSLASEDKQSSQIKTHCYQTQTDLQGGVRDLAWWPWLSAHCGERRTLMSWGPGSEQRAQHWGCPDLQTRGATTRPDPSQVSPLAATSVAIRNPLLLSENLSRFFSLCFWWSWA